MTKQYTYALMLEAQTISKIKYAEALTIINKSLGLQLEINRKKPSTHQQSAPKEYHFLKDEFLARIYEEKG